MEQSPETKGKKILIVEDETDLRNVLSSKCVEEGLSVFAAENGEEALEMALREHPDLIILDIVMPKMTGFEMLEKLREDAWGKHAPVIFLTNSSSMDSISQAIQTGTVDYFIKTETDLDSIVVRIKEKLAAIPSV